MTNEMKLHAACYDIYNSYCTFYYNLQGFYCQMENIAIIDSVLMQFAGSAIVFVLISNKQKTRCYIFLHRQE